VTHLFISMEFLCSLLRRRCAGAQVATSQNVGCFLRLLGWVTIVGKNTKIFLCGYSFAFNTNPWLIFGPILNFDNFVKALAIALQRLVFLWQILKRFSLQAKINTNKTVLKKVINNFLTQIAIKSFKVPMADEVRLNRTKYPTLKLFIALSVRELFITFLNDVSRAGKQFLWMKKKSWYTKKCPHELDTF